MQRKPQAKSQAEILVRELAAAGIEFKHQKALEVVAKLHGFKGWNEMSKAPQPDSTTQEASPLLELLTAKAREVIEYADNTGCGAEWTVTSNSAVQGLSEIVTLPGAAEGVPTAALTGEIEFEGLLDRFEVELGHIGRDDAEYRRDITAQLDEASQLG